MINHMIIVTNENYLETIADTILKKHYKNKSRRTLIYIFLRDH